MGPNPATGLLADVMPECFGIMLIGAELDWTIPMTDLAVICASAFRARQTVAQHFVCADSGYHKVKLKSNKSP